MFKNTDIKVKIIKANQPSKKELLIMRTLISIGFISIVIFLYWFFSKDRIGYSLLYWPLTFVMLFKFLKTLHEWYHYFHISVPKAPELKKSFTVDILTTYCPGEPKEMIIETLEAMQAITYPHTSYLCDEGDDPELKAVCERLGVKHVTRKVKVDAKAGNINNALKQATGDICIILDPDHVPFPFIIDRVLPYFENPETGFVQSVQAYKNQKESLVALGACEQTYHFYGPMMMSMNSYGTAQAIGANCAFRRSALDSIGGHAPGLAEDMHTSMLLHSKGWKSVYIPEILTKGLVPASIPAYYKQQLKWSRGTFDLLVKVIPKIFTKLTLRQKIHYLSIPLYFFYGIIDFLNILIPILTLYLAEFPWQVDLVEFIRVSTPVLIMTLVIRQYSQNWLLERHERGFHMVGGLLRIGTWWVFSLGFIYTLFNIKVPYIPTPKDGEPENSWNLSIPNAIVCILSLTAIIYGLSIDWNPYTFFMAALAGVNILTMGYIVVIGQQKFLNKIFSALQNSFAQKYIFPSRLLWWNFRQGIYTILRKSSFYVACLTFLFVGTWVVKEEREITYYTLNENAERIPLKIYQGIKVNLSDDSLLKTTPISHDYDISYFEIKTKYSNYECLRNKIQKVMDASVNYPMIVIKYSDSTLTEDLIKNKILEIYYTELAKVIKSYNKPIFINPLPNPTIFPESYSYTKQWRNIVDIFKKEGAANVVWVWSADKFMSSDFPGPQYVDWISTTLYKESFKSDYAIFQSKCSGNDYYNIPVLTIIKNESTNSKEKVDNKFLNDLKKLKGIHAIIHEPSSILNLKKSKTNYYTAAKSCSKTIIENKNSFIKGERGKFKFLVDEKPFIIKAISYHSSKINQDGHIPLTRSQLRRDFEKIKGMGANTVRRYFPSIYDKNIIAVAEEKELKLLYGFWFDPNIDYSNDTVRLNKYLNEIEENVSKYKNEAPIVGWVLGNNTYADFQYFFHKPQLYEVRIGYLNFIEKATQLIHQLDPKHPVIAVVSHDRELTAAMTGFNLFVPSADIVGYNCNDLEDLKNLQALTSTHDKNRPYIITELNYEIYQNNKTCNLSACEKTDQEKANTYFWNWMRYVDLFNGYNLGGIAYTWKDRLEGYYTLSGLTDFKGRLKPAYYKLEKLWKDKSVRNPMPWAYISGPRIVKENEIYRFSTIEEFPGEFEYEWFIQTYEITDGLGKIEEIGNDNNIDIKIPENINSFRLYLYINDQHDNVVTFSLPVKVDMITIKD